LIQETIMTETNDTTSNANALLSDWQTKSTAQKRLDDEMHLHNKAALFDALAAGGVTLVEVTFDGCGDSGQIESIHVMKDRTEIDLPAGQIEIARALWGQAEPERSRLSLRDAIEQLAYDLLEQTCGGWEINEGSFGEFKFDVAARTITLDFNERIETSEFSQHVF
jgi:hypothetical protein